VCQLWLSVPGGGGLWRDVIPVLGTGCGPRKRENRRDRQHGTTTLIKIYRWRADHVYYGQEAITVGIHGVCVNAPAVSG
jgi:hypothetical protein